MSSNAIQIEEMAGETIPVINSWDITKSTTDFDASALSHFARNLAQIAVLMMALIAMTVSPESVQAQTAAHGKFTLSSTTRLGDAELPAGDYKYEVVLTSSLPLVNVRAVSGSAGAYVFPAAVAEIAKPEAGEVNLKAANGQYYVSSIVVKELGVELYYAAPKTKTEAPLNVPVHVAGTSSFQQAGK